jgi:hypothetical protein
VSVRVLLFSIAVIAGFSVLASLYASLLGRPSVVLHPAFALAAGLGGYLAARLSPGRNVAEAAVAALVCGLITAVFNLVLDSSLLADNPGSRGLLWIAVVATTCFVAALIGARLGERSSGPAHPLLWLAALAAASIGVVAEGTLLALAAGRIADGLGAVAGLLACIMALFGPSFLAQVTTRSEIPRAAVVAAPPVAALAINGWLLLVDQSWGSLAVVVGMVIAAFAGVMGILGASMGLGLAEVMRPVEGPALPTARHVRS